ncbi:uncharacterized protein LOC134243073, partial [Saccostrea cucullata]|uniref:uncharacterized protein LOC134243073 n=1 Tax=Saccostrea cuccullata TaxID=36930 RepID=UPI002ECFBD9F
CNGTLLAPLPSLAGEDITCYLPSSCSAVQCCINVPVISTTFHTRLEVDPCNFLMTVEVEQLKFTRKLFDYEWGVEEQVWLFGVVRMTFSVFDLYTKGYFIVNLNLEVCLEAAKVPFCEVAIQPLRGYYLPKKICEWNAPFSIKGFSLAAWQIVEGVANTVPIDSSVVDNLLSNLNVAALMYYPSCAWTDIEYSSSTTNLQTYCPVSVQTSLSSVADQALCTVSSSCTNIKCCVNIPLLNRTFEVGMELDYSYYSLKVNVEKMTRRQSLIGYTFGKEETLSVQGVFKFIYEVNDLVDGNLLDISLKAEACFSDGGTCAVSIPILTNALIPKRNRKWSNQYTIKDFSLSHWKTEKMVAGNLKQHHISELLEMLSLQPYMRANSCSRHNPPYNTAGSDGWVNGCTLLNNTMSLNSHPLTCNLDNSCTRVTCCVDSPVINSTFEVFMDIDPCTRMLFLRIENLKAQIPFKDIKWESKNNFHLFNVIRLEYTIYDLYSQNFYLVDLQLSVCWETYKDCVFTATVLQNTFLPKRHCVEKMNFEIPSFSLTSYGVTHGLDLDNLSEADLTYLFNNLAISSYLSPDMCNRTSELYQPANDGWKNECPKAAVLATLPGNVNCHMTSNCTRISCCMEVTRLMSRPVTFHLSVDSCSWMIGYGIDSFIVNPFVMSDFAFDVWHEFWMKGIFRLKFSITDLQAIDQFRVSLKIMACFESGAACDQEVVILNNTLLPKRNCEVVLGTPMKDFSIGQWKAEKMVTTMNEYSIAILEEELGMFGYMFNKTQACDRSTTFSTSSGWTNDCPKTLTSSLPYINGPFSCNLGSSCSEITCCVNAKPIARHLTFTANLEFCGDKITIAIDKFQLETKISKIISTGKEESLNFSGIYQLKIYVEDLANSNLYLVSLSLSACWNGIYSCEEYTILSNNRLPKSLSQPYCNWQGMYADPGFTLTSWLTSMGYPDTAPLTGVPLQDLMEHLKLNRFKGDDCDKTSVLHMPSNGTGWNNTCASPPDLVPLPSTLTCHLPNSCTGLDCCVSSTKLGQSFRTYLDIDPCTSRITLGIDNWRFTELSKESIQMLDTEFQRSIWMNGVARMDIHLKNLWFASKYLVSLNISICLENQSPCEVNQIVFMNALLPKKKCSWIQNLQNGFSLSSWKMNNSLGPHEKLPDIMISKLDDHLGLPSYRKQSKCNRRSSQFWPTFNGWKEDCRLSGLPYNLEKKTSCQLHSSCTSITCCTEDTELQTTVSWFLHIDSCHLKLSVGIEEWKTDFSLINFNFGDNRIYKLGGVYSISYTLYDLPFDSHYMLSVNISICYEPNHCILTESILKDMMLPRPVCDFKITTYDKPGFSLNSWITERELTESSLPEYSISELYEDLGLAMFVKENSCSKSTNFSSLTNGWTKDCPHPITTEGLPPDLACYIPNSCTAVYCCVNASTPFQTSLSAFLDLDPCNNRLLIGIENFIHSLSLYDIPFGQENFYYLKNIIRMRYRIYDLKAERKYQITLHISFCLESSGFCRIESTVFQHALLPKKVCQLYSGFVTTNFSLSHWKSEMGISTLTERESYLLQEDLMIAQYLRTYSCSQQSEVFIPHINHWKDDCGKVHGITQFTASDKINCYLASNCTTVTCCMFDSVLSRNIEVKLNIDSCRFSMRVTIEKLIFDLSLLDIKWGEEIKIDMYGVYDIRMVMQNFYNEHKYLLSMNISQCYEPENCDVHHVLFKNSIIPKAVCDWSIEYQIKDFSLHRWKLNRGLDTSTDAIEDTYIPQLMEELGIASYSKKPMCTISFNNTLRRINGWTTDCAMNISLPTLNHNVNCDLLSSCTGVRCCVHASLLKRNYEIFFSIDHCTSSLSIQIEQVYHNQTLTELQWGTAYEFKLLGVYRIRYIVYDLLEDDVYLLSLEVSDCYESKNPECMPMATFTVFNKAVIPKAQCSWNQSYRIQNFSLKSWLTKNQLENATDLLTHDFKLVQLLDELSISQYFETSMCSISSQSSRFGWTTSCTKSVSRPSITGGLCHLSEDCTSTECCFNVDFLQHNFKTFLSIDPCSKVLLAGIEKLTREISLVDYKYGKVENLWLSGVSRLDFMLEDLYGERLYLVNMNVSFCFESAGECYKSIAVFKDTLLPKRICPWDQSQGFSLSDWKRKYDIPFGPLDNWTKSLLLEYLDIAQYRDSNECKRGEGFYTFTFYNYRDTGFNQNASIISQLCQLAVDLENNPLTIESARRVTCYVPSLCTAVDCCVDVPSLDMSFHTYISIDPCQYTLRIGIEKYSFQRSLDQLRFGQEEVFTLAGIVKMIYKIEDLPAEKLYVMTVKLSVCTETSGCEANHTIFNNMLLPKQPCQWNEGFVNMNFSGSAWMTNNGYTTPLSESQSAELMKEIKAAPYLLADSCDPDSGVYSSPVSGWNNYCPKEMSLTNLTGSSVTCHIPYLCNEIQCCVRAESIRRSFQVVVSLDPCSQIMLIKLERMTIKVDLLNFQFGKTQQYSLVGFLRADLKLFDLPYQKQYVISLELSVCLESSGTCNLVSTALDNSLLPKTECDWSLELEGFSLQNWLATNGESIGTVSLPEHVQYMLLEERGIANMMKDTPCSRTGGTMYNSSTPVNGWLTDCTSLTSNLTELPSEITCYYHGSCAAVSCCMDIVKFDNRSVEVSIIFDECANFLTLTIERISQTVYLHNFSYGIEQKLTLKGIFQLRYTVTQNMYTRKYEFKVDIMACYEPLYCDQVVTILNQVSFDMKDCTYQEGFLNSSFSLSAWLASRAIPSVDDMTVPQASDLLTELGLDHFLDSTDRCLLSDTVYGAAAGNGWNNECEKYPNYTLPSISNKVVVCHIPSTCDRVSCCVYIAPVQRHTEVKLLVNTCSYQMEALIDNLKISRNLFTYTWGTMEKIGIHGVIRFG